MRPESYTEPKAQKTFMDLAQAYVALALVGCPALFCVGLGLYNFIDSRFDGYRWESWPHVTAVSTSVQLGSRTTRTAFTYERAERGGTFPCHAEAASGGGLYSHKSGLPYRVGERFEIAIDPSACGSFVLSPEPPLQTPFSTQIAILGAFLAFGAGLFIFLLN